MKNLVIISIGCVLSFFTLKGQINIVPNPSFETFTNCPTGLSQWYRCNDWNSVNMFVGSKKFSCPAPYTVGSPDYYKTCGTGGSSLPSSYAGFTWANSGSSCMGLVLYNQGYPNSGREYLSSQLTCPMLPGITYTLSFFLTNGTGQISPWTIKNIGIHFSSSPLVQNCMETISVTPQCEITTNVASNSWVQYTFAITPTNVWNYITFGTFRSDTQNNPIQTYPMLGSINGSANPKNGYAHYFLDDITVLRPSNLFSITPIVSQATICGTASSASISVSNPTLSLNYFWSPGSYTTSSVSNLNTGIYTVSVVNQNGCNSSTVTTNFTIQPTPTLNVSASPNTICSGFNSTLVANGATNYTWYPSLQTGSSIVVSPTITTTYTLVGATNTCVNTSTVKVTVISSPQINITSTSPFVCQGTTNTLVATGAANFTWQPGSLLGNSVFVSPTVSTIYTVTGNLFGCIGSNTIVQNLGSIIPITTNNATLCTNASTFVNISATTSFTGGGVTYNWQPGFLNGQNINVSPSVNTIYTVTASSPFGCPSTNTLLVTITNSCCSQPTTGWTHLTNLGGTYSNGSFFIAQNITITSTTFRDAEVLFMPGVQITVPNHETLTLENAHLYACGINMWQGVVVDDGGSMYSDYYRGKSSLIEDAIVAVDLDQINMSSNMAPMPIEFKGTIFNKNHIGIKLSNSDPNLVHLPLNISECVFSSRDLMFTSTTWPNADMSVTGLRFAAPGSTTGIVPPYSLQGYSQALLKLPFSQQPGHIGIKIENIGNQGTGSPTSAGIDIGVTNASKIRDFNLFDGLGVGIDVTDASLTTANNVFQNAQYYLASNSWFGGIGIRHSTTGDMNALLHLNTAGQNNVSYGNRFWDCHVGVAAYNILDVMIDHSIFRSTQKNTQAGFLPGMYGVNLYTNRFNYTIKNSEFNNISSGIMMRLNSGPYDVGSGYVNGTYAGNLEIDLNYFGAEVNSTMNLNMGQFGIEGIHFDGGSASNWQINGVGRIISNKVDRIFNGIIVKSTSTFPVEIGGNEIYIIDDYFGNDQYGIFVAESQDGIFINQNIVKGEGYNPQIGWNNRLKLIYSRNNQSSGSNPSPIINCNQVFDGYVGFEFDSDQPSTQWFGNTLYQKMHKGLYLSNMSSAGGIGMQGSFNIPCGVRWNDNSNSAPDDWLSNWQTYVDGNSSAAPGTYLWCENPWTAQPITNGADPGGTPFSLGPWPSDSYEQSIGGVDCLYPTVYPTAPSQRGINTSSDELLNQSKIWDVQVFPNPSNSVLFIKSNKPVNMLTITIYDIIGREVYYGVIESDKVWKLDISHLNDSMYFLKIQNGNEVTTKKIVKE
jgi:hypothetical protein